MNNESKKHVHVLECLDEIAHGTTVETADGTAYGTADRGLLGESFRYKCNNILLCGGLLLIEILRMHL